MNVLLLFFKSHFVQFVGWILLHSIWQGALIALSFRFTEHFSNKASDQFRYAAACGALLLMCVAPVCTVLLSGVPSGGITVPSVTVSQSQTQPIGAPGETPLASPAAPSRSVSDLLNRVAPFTTLAWLVGVSIFSVRMSRGWLQLRSLRLAPAEPVPPHWLERLADLRCRLEITRPVILMKSALVQVPSVMGWLRPIILFPAAAISELSPDQLDAILAHELAHIRRNDFLVNVFQCLPKPFSFITRWSGGFPGASARNERTVAMIWSLLSARINSRTPRLSPDWNNHASPCPISPLVRTGDRS